MAKEIERKYLVDISKLPLSDAIESYVITQGYIMSDSNKSLRIRKKNDKAYITLKSKLSDIARNEFEYEIPLSDFNSMFPLCNYKLIEKVRYIIPYNNQLFEVDIFDGDNLGLILAEIELTDEDTIVDLPDWITEEVTYDKSYYNENLINNPYKNK